jgi:hypothetical protein
MLPKGARGDADRISGRAFRRAGFNIFLREVVCRPVHLVLPLGREDIDIDRILGAPRPV